MPKESLEFLDKARDKQSKNKEKEQVPIPEPIFATEQELNQKQELAEQLKQAREDTSLLGRIKYKEILLKLKKLGETRKQRIEREKRELLGRENIIQARTPENQEIEINLETERIRWQTFYENHNFKDKVNIPEINLNQDQIQEIQTLIEQGFVDSMAIIPDHLTYQELLPEMAKGYAETYQGDNFKEDGSFATLDQQELIKQPQYRIIFYKKVQNLEHDKILKATKGKSPDQIDEYLKQINKQHNTDIQGISLKDYLIIQREFTETTNPGKNIQDESRHMDESGWSWCLKSRFKNSGRVVDAGWLPGSRRLSVSAGDSSGSYSRDGSRLSRSFPA